MLKRLLWFLGFQAFYRIKHPRSRFLRAVRALFKRLPQTTGIGSHERVSPVPNRIWIYWAQGWDDAPPLVSACRESWILRNPEFEVVSLSDANLGEYVPLERKQIPHAAYSDIVRLRLVSKYGGVWVDATTFCTAPLAAWLPNVTESGFFAFQKPKSTLASWFIATVPDHYLVRAWDTYVDRYWRVARTPGPYFWLHYLFEYLLLLDAKARGEWSAVPAHSSDGPYAVQRCLKAGKGGACGDMLSDKVAPVHKLDWKIELPDGFVGKLRGQLG